MADLPFALVPESAVKELAAHLDRIVWDHPHRAPAEIVIERDQVDAAIELFFRWQSTGGAPSRDFPALGSKLSLLPNAAIFSGRNYMPACSNITAFRCG